MQHLALQLLIALVLVEGFSYDDSDVYRIQRYTSLYMVYSNTVYSDVYGIAVLSTMFIVDSKNV